MESNDANRERSSALENAAELALLKRIAAYDRAALTELYLAYHGRLFKFVYRLTSSHTIAEEMVNDVMLVVWRKADSFRGESKVSTWIFGIAYRLAMRRLSKRQKRLLRQVDTMPELAAEEAPLEVEDWVQSGLDELPSAQQIAVILVFYLGLSYEEVASVTDCPVNTVKTRMFHARKKLRQFLAPTSSSEGVGT